MSNPLIVERMIEEVSESLAKEQDAKRKLRNKKKAERQKARPQGKRRSIGTRGQKKTSSENHDCEHCEH